MALKAMKTGLRKSNPKPLEYNVHSTLCCLGILCTVITAVIRIRHTVNSRKHPTVTHLGDMTK